MKSVMLVGALSIAGIVGACATTPQRSPEAQTAPGKVVITDTAAADFACPVDAIELLMRGAVLGTHIAFEARGCGKQATYAADCTQAETACQVIVLSPPVDASTAPPPPPAP